MSRSAVRNSARNSRRQAYPHQGSSTLPRANLIANIPNRYPFIDRIGKHDGPAQLRQFAEVVSGTVTLYHPGITGSETITSSGGDAPVSVVAGGIVIGVGKKWAIRDSGGHHWSHCAALTITSVVMWDVGLGDHLIAEGLAEAVVTALCSTSRDLTVGTDWLDRGFTVADGTQYLHPVSGGLIPDDVAIPKLESGLGCCAFTVVGG